MGASKRITSEPWGRGPMRMRECVFLSHWMLAGGPPGLPLENRGVWGGRFSKSISDSQTWEACSSVGNRTSVSLDSSQESRLAGEPQGEEQHVFWHRPPVNEMRRSYMSFHFLVGLVASHHREGPGELEPADQATYIFKCSIFSRFFQYSPVFFFPFHVVPGVIA